MKCEKCHIGRLFMEQTIDGPETVCFACGFRPLLTTPLDKPQVGTGPRSTGVRL